MKKYTGYHVRGAVCSTNLYVEIWKDEARILLGELTHTLSSVGARDLIRALERAAKVVERGERRVAKQKPEQGNAAGYGYEYTYVKNVGAEAVPAGTVVSIDWSKEQKNARKARKKRK